MSESPASILLIDDHPLLRQGIKQLIDMEDDMSVAGEASNSADGIRLATELEPDLIHTVCQNSECLQCGSSGPCEHQ